MADKNITEFPAADVLNASDVFHIAQGGVDKQVEASVVLQSIEGGNPFDVTPLEESTTSRFVTLGDKDKFIQCLNASGCTVTLPNFSNAPFKVGDQLSVKNDSIGSVTFAADAGVTIREAASGLALPDKGQAATFINVGTNIWNMVSGGGGGSTGTQRFKVTRTTDLLRTGDGTATNTVDPQLTISGLTEGSTYKVEAMVAFQAGATATNTFRYLVYGNDTGVLGQSDFLTHIADYSGTDGEINNDAGGTLALNVIGPVGTSIFGNARITGEIEVPAGSNSISLYWGVVENGSDMSVLTGSSLVVEST